MWIHFMFWEIQNEYRNAQATKLLNCVMKEVGKMLLQKQIAFIPLFYWRWCFGDVGARWRQYKHGELLNMLFCFYFCIIIFIQHLIHFVFNHSFNFSFETSPTVKRCRLEAMTLLGAETWLGRRLRQIRQGRATPGDTTSVSIKTSI